MKKQFLLTFCLFISVGLFAQTIIKLPDNTQYGSANSFQAKVASIIPSDYQAKVGDLITINLAGTSNYDLTEFQLVFSDIRPAVAYWDELSGWKGLDDVTASTAFTYSATLAITKEAVDAGGDYMNLVLEAVSRPAIDASAPDITLTLSTFEISIESTEKGIISLTDNGTGAYQGDFPDTLAISPIVAVGNNVRVTIEGSSNVAITDFQVAVIDGTEAANYWKELSAYTAFGDNGTAAAGTPFSLTSNIGITSVPTGSGFKSQFIVIKGVSTETIKLTLTKFTAEIVNDKTATSNVAISTSAEAASIEVYSINGIRQKTVKSIDEMERGIYILVNTYNDGSTSTSKIVKTTDY